MKKHIFQISILCLSCLLLMLPNKTRAQNKNEINNQITICGEADSAIAVHITVFPELFINYGTYLSNQSINLKDEKKFNFHFAAGKEPIYIRVAFSYKKKTALSIESYLVEAGDSIFIQESNRQLTFSGSNTDKFKCQFEIKKLLPKKTGGDLAKVPDLYEDLQKWNSSIDSLSAKKLKILAANKYLFSEKTYELLKSDCIYENRNEYEVIDYYIRVFRRDSIRQKQAIQYYLDFYARKVVEVPSVYIIQHSSSFVNYFLWKIKCDLLIKNINYKTSLNPDISRHSVFNYIVSNCKDCLKESCLTVLFKEITSINDTISADIKKTLVWVKNPVYRQALMNIARKTSGSIAYNFRLPDTSGRMFELANFKNKVVVIDFWYTGCIWCPVMADIIKPIAAEKDTNVVFVSVSADAIKNVWKKSVSEGKYTSLDEINLYTDGMGYDHPFIKYYDIHTYPSVYIIDRQGKISTINPIIASTSSTEPIKLRGAISAALKIY